MMEEKVIQEIPAIPNSILMKPFVGEHQKRRTFSKEEDARLLYLVKYYGDDWTKISILMPFRSSRQCKERYEGYLSPSINHGKFSEEEDLLLIEKYEEFGSKWTKISQYFEGRSGNQLKNRWNTYIIKLTDDQINKMKQNKIKNQSNDVKSIEDKKFFDLFNQKQRKSDDRNDELFFIEEEESCDDLFVDVEDIFDLFQ